MTSTPATDAQAVPTVEDLVREMFDEAGQPLPEEGQALRVDADASTWVIRPGVIFDLPTKLETVVEVLGPDLATRLTGAVDKAELDAWLEDSLPPESMAQRACMAFTVTRELRKIRWQSQVIRSWFAGANPGLRGESPADVIAERSFPEAAGLLASATLAELQK